MNEEQNNRSTEKVHRLILLRNSREQTMTQLFNAKAKVYTSIHENFLFVPESKYFAMFTCKKNLEVLCSKNIKLIAEQLPCLFQNLFKSFYVIHGYQNGLHIPLVTVTMVNKESRAYRNFWHFLKEKCTIFGFDFSPMSIQVDFDKLTNHRLAVHSVLPCCHVLVSQLGMTSIWYRALHDMTTLKGYYKTDTEYGNWLNAIFGLPFLPADQVSDGFTDLISEAPGSTDELMMFPDLILTEYIGEDSEDNVRYPPYMWARRPTVNPSPVLTAKKYISRVQHRSASKGDPNVSDVVRVLIAIQSDNYDLIKDFSTLNFPGFTPEQNQISQLNYEIWQEYENGKITRLEYLRQIGKMNSNF